MDFQIDTIREVGEIDLNFSSTYTGYTRPNPNSRGFLSPLTPGKTSNNIVDGFKAMGGKLVNSDYVEPSGEETSHNKKETSDRKYKKDYGFPNSDEESSVDQVNKNKTLIWVGIGVAVLATGFIFLKLARNKK